MKNVQADTEMRTSIAKPEQKKRTNNGYFHSISFYFYHNCCISELILGKKKKAGTKPVPGEPAPQPYSNKTDYTQVESLEAGEDNFAIIKR